LYVCLHLQLSGELSLSIPVSLGYKPYTEIRMARITLQKRESPSPSGMLFTNPSKFRQFSPSNSFLFILKYVNALKPISLLALLVARTQTHRTSPIHSPQLTQPWLSWLLLSPREQAAQGHSTRALAAARLSFPYM